jgi:hypothetical protein
MSRVERPPAQAVVGLLAGARLAQAISVAARLGLADLLDAGSRTPAELAASTATNADALRRMLRTLAGAGIFAEEEASGRFRLTPLAGPLRSTAPDSIRAYAVMAGERWIWQALGAMEHTVRTGEPAFDHVFGMPLFDYYARHPAAGRVSVEGLRSVGRGEDAAVAAAYDFSRAPTIIDLGGGQGGLLAAILRAAPEARGTLFDLPHVMDAARRQVEEAGVATRVRLETGDFFRSVPAGGDVYLLRKVLHDWDDDKARAILQVCRRAMTADARLLIVETLVAPGNTPCHAKELDLLMMVYTGGRERTEQEYRELLDATGFALERTLATASTMSIIEAKPV